MKQETSKVTLGQYRGLVLKREPIVVEDYEIEEELQQLVRRKTVVVDITDRPSANGDMLIIDFEGFMDGVAFPGGKGSNYDLIIGSHSFIDTFEEQLIGYEAGDYVEVNVTFPKEYHAKELAGKPAMFKVTIKAIKERRMPKLDDDFAKQIMGCDDMEAARAKLREELKASRAKYAEDARTQMLLAKAVANAEIEISEERIMSGVNMMMQDISMNLERQGITMEKYIQIQGTTMDAIIAQVRPQAEIQARTRLVLETIAAEEHIETTEEELNGQLEDMAKYYKMSLEDVKTQLNEESLDMIRQDLAVQKAAQIIFTTAVEE